MPSMAPFGLALLLKAPISIIAEGKVRPVAPWMVEAKSGTMAKPRLGISMVLVFLFKNQVTVTVGSQTQFSHNPSVVRRRLCVV